MTSTYDAYRKISGLVESLWDGKIQISGHESGFRLPHSDKKIPSLEKGDKMTLIVKDGSVVYMDHERSSFSGILTVGLHGLPVKRSFNVGVVGIASLTVMITLLAMWLYVVSPELDMLVYFLWVIPLVGGIAFAGHIISYTKRERAGLLQAFSVS